MGYPEMGHFGGSPDGVRIWVPDGGYGTPWDGPKGHQGRMPGPRDPEGPNMGSRMGSEMGSFWGPNLRTSP